MSIDDSDVVDWLGARKTELHELFGRAPDGLWAADQLTKGNDNCCAWRFFARAACGKFRSSSSSQRM